MTTKGHTEAGSEQQNKRQEALQDAPHKQPAQAPAHLSFTEKREGPKDRRAATTDRRNEDRVNEDFEPRRNPEVYDRRQAV